MPEILEGQEHRRMTPEEQEAFDNAAKGNQERPFLPDSTRDVLADRTAKILEFKRPQSQTQPEVESVPEVSDKTQKFISDLEHAKTYAERVGILSKAIQSGLSPADQEKVFGKAHDLKAA